MSAATESPPSPSSSPPSPPPPPHTSGFDDLPAELLMIIYQYIGLDQYMNLALAIYPTLLRHRMVPELTEETVFRISWDASSPLFDPQSESAVARMPIELWLQIAEYGEPANSVALHWALGLRFWRSFERPSAEMVDTLRVWSWRSKKKKKK